MTQKNKSYWQQRAEAKVLDIEKMGLIYESQMKEGFLQASRNIQDDITKLYVRYAKDNKLSYAETLKYLRDDERAEFQHDLDYYIKNASNADYRFEHRQELQALSVRARVKRMEAMKARIILESEKLFNSLEQGTMALYHRAYDEAYHRTAFDVFQKVGVGMAFDKPSPNTIKTLLEYPWSGKSYSQSLWDMEKGFVDNLNRTLTAGLIQGKSVQELSRQFRDDAIGKDFYKGKPKGILKKAQRLVRTETAFILNQATSDMYDELGVDEYEFLGTLDSKTCEHCGGLDGKHYVSDEKKIGINYPPMHPWCRCTTVPYFPEDEDEDTGQRIARGEDGKNYYVPADMDYKQWREGLSEDGLGKRRYEKNIELPSNLKSSKTLSDDIKEAIENGLKEIEKTYDVRIDEFVYEAISGSNKVPFQFQPINNDGYFKSRLVVNKTFDWEENLAMMNERIYNKNYIKGILASKNVGDLITHEVAHVMSFQDCETWGSFLVRERELREFYVEGISVYADVSQDGAECLAEAFVRTRNKENIPEPTKRLVNEYIERWKK